MFLGLNSLIINWCVPIKFNDDHHNNNYDDYESAQYKKSRARTHGLSLLSFLRKGDQSRTRKWVACTLPGEFGADQVVALYFSITQVILYVSLYPIPESIILRSHNLYLFAVKAYPRVLCPIDEQCQQ